MGDPGSVAFRAALRGSGLRTSGASVEPPRKVEQILDQYGLTPEKLEEQFKAYLRSVR